MPGRILQSSDFAAVAASATPVHAALRTWLETSYSEESQIVILAALSAELARLIAVSSLRFGFRPDEVAANVRAVGEAVAAETYRLHDPAGALSNGPRPVDDRPGRDPGNLPEVQGPSGVPLIDGDDPAE